MFGNAFDDEIVTILLKIRPKNENIIKLPYM